MPLLDFGTTTGLAYRHNYQQDIANLHQEERLDDFARQRAKQETAEMADMFKFGSANNEFDRNNLRTFTSQVSNQLGGYVNQNPDFKFDVGKMLYVKQLSNSLLDNDHTRRSLYFDKQIAATQKYMQEHPDVMTPEELNSYKTQMANRAHTGGINADGTGGEYTFVPPQSHIDFDKHLADRMQQVRMSETKPIGGGNSLLYAGSNDITSTVNAVLADQKMYREAALRFEQQPQSVLDEYKGMDHKDAIYKWTAHIGAGLTKTQKIDDKYALLSFEYGLKSRLKAQGKAGTASEAMKPMFNIVKQLDAQKKQGIETPTTNVPVKFVKDLFPTLPNKVWLRSRTGYAPISMPPGVKMNYAPDITGVTVNGESIPMVNFEAGVTADQLEQFFPNQGVFESKWYDPYVPGEDIKTDNVAPEFRDMITPHTDKDGNTTYVIRVQAPFDTNENNSQLLNASFPGKKLEPLATYDPNEDSFSGGGNEPTYNIVESDGKQYIDKGNGEYIPYNP